MTYELENLHFDSEWDIQSSLRLMAISTIRNWQSSCTIVFHILQEVGVQLKLSI
jgi:hypothetical protein